MVRGARLQRTRNEAIFARLGEATTSERPVEAVARESSCGPGEARRGSCGPGEARRGSCGPGEARGGSCVGPAKALADHAAPYRAC